MLWSEVSCIGSAGRHGVFGREAASTNSIIELLAGAVVNVPKIAEVDTVVVIAGRLGAGVSVRSRVQCTVPVCLLLLSHLPPLPLSTFSLSLRKSPHHLGKC